MELTEGRKVLISIAVALLAVVVPGVALKVVLGLVSLVFLGSALGKAGIVFVLLSIILFVIPVSVLRVVKFGFVPWFERKMWMHSIPFDNLDNLNKLKKEFRENFKNKILPDVKIEGANVVNIDFKGAIEITFEPSVDGIMVPSDVEVKWGKGNVFLNGAGEDDSLHVFVVGRSNLENLFVKADYVYVKGKSSERIAVFSVVSDEFNGNFDIDAAVITIRTDAGVFNANIKANSLEIHGDALVFDLDLEGVQNFSINADVITGKVTYVDVWLDRRFLSATADAGVLTIKIPKEAGELFIQKSGDKFLVVRKRY